MNALVDKLVNGELKLRDVENHVDGSNKAAEVRRAYFEKKAGIKTEHIGSHTIDMNASHGARTSNEIGVIQTIITSPGELAVNGNFASGTYPIFIAKEEGMLTEGIARGIGVLNAAGGVTTRVEKDGMARDIMVTTGGIVESQVLADWIKSPQGTAFLKGEFNKYVGNHGEFMSVDSTYVGTDFHIRFVGTTGAANGMNKVTIASSKTVNAMITHLKETSGMCLDLASESGNMCTDKKPSQINSINGRGVSVNAEIVISKEIIAEKFKGLTPNDIADLNTRKNLVGSNLAGSIGGNAHMANMLSGIYAATGQDMAHVVSGAQGLTYMKVDKNGDLYVTLRMPTVEVATYGGATKNESCKEVLRLMGLYGENDNEGVTRKALAEVVAAVCLAGELNLIAVQAQKELALSHGSLRRD